MGPPEVVRYDNGTQLYNDINKALYDAFGVAVKRGAVRHSQLLGAAERFNRTLLTLIHKAITASDDWANELKMLLYYYHMGPHSVTGISSFQAMVGWTPRSLIVENQSDAYSLSAWVDELTERAIRVRDYLEEELAKTDFPESDGRSPYEIGDQVLLRVPDRHQKRMTPYEPGGK